MIFVDFICRASYSNPWSQIGDFYKSLNWTPEDLSVNNTATGVNQVFRSWSRLLRGRGRGDPETQRTLAGYFVPGASRSHLHQQRGNLGKSSLLLWTERSALVSCASASSLVVFKGSSSHLWYYSVTWKLIRNAHSDSMQLKAERSGVGAQQSVFTENSSWFCCT